MADQLESTPDPELTEAQRAILEAPDSETHWRSGLTVHPEGERVEQALAAEREASTAAHVEAGRQHIARETAERENIGTRLALAEAGNEIDKALLDGDYEVEEDLQALVLGYPEHAPQVIDRYFEKAALFGVEYDPEEVEEYKSEALGYLATKQNLDSYKSERAAKQAAAEREGERVSAAFDRMFDGLDIPENERVATYAEVVNQVYETWGVDVTALPGDERVEFMRETIAAWQETIAADRAARASVAIIKSTPEFMSGLVVGGVRQVEDEFEAYRADLQASGQIVDKQKEFQAKVRARIEASRGRRHPSRDSAESIRRAMLDPGKDRGRVGRDGVRDFDDPQAAFEYATKAAEKARKEREDDVGRARHGW
jgi:hypothetical protein